MFGGLAQRSHSHSAVFDSSAAQRNLIRNTNTPTICTRKSGCQLIFMCVPADSHLRNVLHTHTHIHTKNTHTHTEAAVFRCTPSTDYRRTPGRNRNDPRNGFAVRVRRCALFTIALFPDRTELNTTTTTTTSALDAMRAGNARPTKAHRPSDRPTECAAAAAAVAAGCVGLSAARIDVGDDRLMENPTTASEVHTHVHIGVY